MIVLLVSLFDDGNTTSNNNSNNANSNELENVSNVSGYADNHLKRLNRNICDSQTCQMTKCSTFDLWSDA